MEDQRATSGGFFRVAMLRSPVSLSAAFSVGILVLAAGWSFTHEGTPAVTPVPIAQASAGTQTPDQQVASSEQPQSATSTQNLSNIAPAVVGTIEQEYEALQQEGVYSTSTAEAAAAQLAPDVKAPLTYPTYSVGDLSVTQDVSEASIKQYQAAVRQALSPLSQNTTPEIGIFAEYVQTGNSQYLTQLHAVANEYAEAAASAATIQVPANAVQQHVAILNAMEEYSATLEALADNASDPFAVMATLNTYNDAQAAMVSSFDEFASYIQAQHLSS